MKSFLLISFLSIFFLSSCYNDLGCLFQFPNEKNQQTVFEILAEDNQTKFTILRETTYGGDGINFKHEYTFFQDRYTLDKRASIIDGGYFNYGNDLSNYEEPLKIEYYDFDFYSIDYSPSKNQSLFLSSEQFYIKIDTQTELDSISTANRYLISYDHTSLAFDTLLSFTSEYIDSTKILELAPIKVRYDLQGNAIFNLEIYESYINFSSDSSSYVKDSDLIKSSLNKITSSGIDTLFKMSNSVSFDYELATSDIYITIFDQGTYKLQEDGQVKFIADTYIPELFSLDETMYLEKYRDRLYDMSNDIIFEVEDYVQNSFIVFPSQNELIIKISNKPDVLYIFDYSSKLITDSITVSDLPDLGRIKNEDFSRFQLINPLFTEDNNLIFMAIRKSYLIDPDFRCYD